eukprot:410442_1
MGNISCCGTDKKSGIYEKIAELKRMRSIDNKNTQKKTNNTNCEINNWIEEEQNMKMDRVHKLSLIEIDDADKIRELVKQEYIDGHTSSVESESNVSELSSASRQEITEFDRKSDQQLLKLGKTNPRKSNLTPTSRKMWNDNDLIDMQNEMKQQMEYLKNAVKYSTPNDNAGTDMPDLFRVQSYDKWDKNDVINEQFAMQEQIVHLIQRNSQSKTETNCSKSTASNTFNSNTFTLGIQNNNDTMDLHTDEIDNHELINVYSDDSNDSNLIDIEDANADDYLPEIPQIKPEDMAQFIMSTISQNYD